MAALPGKHFCSCCPDEDTEAQKKEVTGLRLHGGKRESGCAVLVQHSFPEPQLPTAPGTRKASGFARSRRHRPTDRPCTRVGGHSRRPSTELQPYGLQPCCLSWAAPPRDTSWGTLFPTDTWPDPTHPADLTQTSFLQETSSSRWAPLFRG